VRVARDPSHWHSHSTLAMSDIPRVPHVLPSSLVNPQVHRTEHASDRQPRKEHEKPQEDILELHDLDEEITEDLTPFSETSSGEDSFDIAV
jgi:hypothetical protein